MPYTVILYVSRETSRYMFHMKRYKYNALESEVIIRLVTNKKNNKIMGNLGEDIAEKYLRNKGFIILERNYLRKWGEIDIVTRGTGLEWKNSDVSYETSEKVHFVEVKSVSYETKEELAWAVTHETWRPEEMVHFHKMKQIRKVVESWLIENNWEGDIQIDVIAVRIVSREKYATVKYIPNIILD